MARGKQTCKILKEIRRQIAAANDIEFITSECRFKGDCLGTCPKCEAEVRYLEQQLRARSLAGKLVNLAGISAGAIALMTPASVKAQDIIMPDTTTTAIHASTDTILVKGVVLAADTLPNGEIRKEPLIGASIINNTRTIGTATDIDGNFEIEALAGDSLEIRYVGFFTQEMIVTPDTANVEIILVSDPAALGGEIIAGGAPAITRPDRLLELYIKDEKGNIIDEDDFTVVVLLADWDGDLEIGHLTPEPIYDDNGYIKAYRINWSTEYHLFDDDGNMLKEATLVITAKGYDDPVTLKVKCPKKIAKKTVRFRPSRK